MAKVYTKTGDKGQTSLVGGTRVSKSDKRLHLYGQVDELNSYIGLLNSMEKEEGEILEKIQNNLFNLGSHLACEEEKREVFSLPELEKDLIECLEAKIDELDSQLEVLKNFILPGGTPLSAHIHVARTICRRVERSLVDFMSISQPLELSLEFLNRLSDFLFIYARYENKRSNQSEKIWKTK
ncbi:MAG: cob(I)yrinic acid a,c-diamide adenosyltransferase [Bacteriovoracaceae bacterium]|jgi:cob(I)alamin adenosyltransferase|nr:cob(I)yrinic acid a,c-diamide adenosyltransferase [Bacteriovoracaceae bacterium]